MEVRGDLGVPLHAGRAVSLSAVLQDATGLQSAAHWPPPLPPPARLPAGDPTLTAR